MTELILHLASNDAWLAAAKRGAYYADSLSTAGFIHCSKPSQIVGVANTFYHGQRGLVLLVIDPSKLKPELKWEPPAEPEPTHARAGDLFPHIYGPLNLEAVVKVLPFEPGANGSFSLPPNMIS
ncbi:MAG: DUF952 domain-containing protein [Anaerolineales bacterium]|nr:DUF952 domain-containing protein [Anaerolineales bacterium]